MTGRPWFYEDVAFSDADAEAVIAALRRVRGNVDALGEVRATAAREARDGWSGRFRDDFDRELPGTQQGLGDACALIDDIIRSIRSAQGRAEEDRAERQRLRTAHEAEQAEIARLRRLAEQAEADRQQQPQPTGGGGARPR